MLRYLIFFCCLFISFATRGEDGNNWAEVYAQIKENYLGEVKISTLATTALKGINEVDKHLHLADDDSRLTLYYKGKVVKVARKPQDMEDVNAWGNITTTMIEAARNSSPKADEKSFQIDDALAHSLVKVLDKDSKVFSNINEANGISSRNHRTFAERMEDDGTLYIKIVAFNKQTVTELQQAIEENSTATNLLLDLRDCSGGQASAAIQGADLFLSDGVIASYHGREAWKQTYYNADEFELMNGKNITILVNHQTASAAEILAAALKEQGRAHIKGEKTFGKGTLQKLITLPSGSVLAVTSGLIQTPSGEELNDNGVMPNEIIEPQKLD